MARTGRQLKLIEIINKNEIETQEALAEALRNEGYLVTQATVSRDIKELGLIKLPLADGSYKYAVTKEEKPEHTDHIMIFSKSIISIQAAMHTIVVKVRAGMANAVAASLDNLIGHEVVGTIAGDDTFLIIMENPQSAEEMAARLRKIFSWKE